MNELVSYYEKIEEILYPCWRVEKIEGQYLNLGDYINQEIVGKIDFHRLKQMISHLTDHDKAVIEIARGKEKTRESHDKPNKEIRKLQREIGLLTIELTELQTEKKKLISEIEFYKRFESTTKS